MRHLPLLGIVLAAVSAFPLGYLWYGPLFGAAKLRETGLTEAQLRSGNPALVFGGSFLLNLITAFALAWLMQGLLGHGPPVLAGLYTGAIAGIGLVATAYGVTTLFSHRSLTLWAIDGGYMAARLTLMGLVIGWLWF